MSVGLLRDISASTQAIDSSTGIPETSIRERQKPGADSPSDSRSRPIVRHTRRTSGSCHSREVAHSTIPLRCSRCSRASSWVIGPPIE